MTSFEALALIAALVGFGIPAWIFALALYHAAKRPRSGEPSARFFAYSRLIESIHSQIKWGDEFIIDNGALFAATVRELKDYPEFGDLTLLYLEEINVTGSKKFSQVMRTELQAVETHLLGSRSE